MAPTSTVRGSVSDRNLASFTVSAAPAGTPLVELVRGAQGFSDERDLAPLSSLAEGPHVLSVFASDVAENETRIDRSFLVVATPPRATIQSPVTGAVLRRGETPIPVAGLVLDDHLEQWTLRFGAGAEPATFTPIAQGETGGQALSLGAWGVRFVPDGVYTLSLVATDRAGLSTESRVTVTLDGTPPTVALASLVGGGYVTAPGPILGTAADTNIASWELESAPGDAATAYRWSPIVSGSRSVSDATLAEWAPLPPDGVYTLRLTARDEVELVESILGGLQISMKNRKLIDLPYVIGLMLLPIILAGGFLLVTWISGLARYDPALFTLEYQKRYAVPSPLLEDLEIALRSGDEALMAELQGTRREPANLEALPKVRFLIYWDSSGEYTDYLFMDTKNYKRYLQHLRLVDGRYCASPTAPIIWLTAGVGSLSSVLWPVSIGC